MNPAPAPLIAACLRITDLRPEVDPLSGTVTHDRLAVGLSAADEAALEHALRLAAGWSGRVVAASVGPRSIEPVLREVMALGVDVVRIPDGEGQDEPFGAGQGSPSEIAGDEHALARAVAAALGGGGGAPDLVVCGDRSADRGTGAFPAFLAHELGAAQALGLVTLAAGDAVDRPPLPGRAGPGGRVLLAERRLDGGWRERLSVPLPAVCSVEGAGVRLRRATLTGALAAAEAEVPLDRSASEILHAARERTGSIHLGRTRAFVPRTRVVPAPAEADPRERMTALTGALVAYDPPTVIGPVDASEAAGALVDFLVRHGYLEAAPGGTVGREVPR